MINQTVIFKEKAVEVTTIGHYAAERGWCPANGGNFSARLDEQHAVISASGANKGSMKIEDILAVNFQGEVVGSTRKPSDETLLHTALYSLDPSIGAVLHVHSVPNTVLSLQIKAPALLLNGYEMLKALRGVNTHETKIEVPIFDNSQDMAVLAAQIKSAWDRLKDTQAFLVRGHGCYCWGQHMKEAKNHLEAYEFLFACELERLQCKS